MLFNTYKPWKFAFSQDTEDLEKTKPNKWGILGVPFDSTSSYSSGSRFGPTTVREASYSFEKFNMAINAYLATTFYDFGNVNVVHGNCKKTIAILEEVINELATVNIKPILIGGEHSISLAPIKALANKYKIEEMTIIHLDAHMDLINEYQREKCSHATVMRRVHDLNPKEIIEIGIRSGSLDEKKFAQNQDNIAIFTSKDTKERFRDIENKLNLIDNNEPIYLSIDIDVLDPSFVGEVGNPIPNGLSPETIEKLLEILTKKNIIGFDLVELATNRLGDSSAVTAAKIIYDFLTLLK